MTSSSPTTNPPAVILLSGGLDSATTLAIAKSQNYTCHALTFDYGQRHRIELNAARNVAQSIGVTQHRWVEIDLRVLGHSALTDDIDVPKDRNENQMAADIPITYVPARNTIFLSYALAWAEIISSSDIFIGVNALDYSGYPDCRPQYIAAFQAMANLATKAATQDHKPITIHTPLIDLSKTKIIQKGLALDLDYSITHSCYDPTPTGRPCGHCDSCLIRIQAFEKLGMVDPAMEEPPNSDL